MSQRPRSPAEITRLAGLSDMESFGQRATDVARDVADWCRTKSWHSVVACGRRTMAMQAALWAHGRTQRPDGTWAITTPRAIRTWARPGTSAHQYGLAIDLPMIVDSNESVGTATSGEWLPDTHPAWDELEEIAQRHGLETGNRWLGLRDAAHIQLPHWREHIGEQQ